MAASYPSAIKTFVQLEDGVDTVFAAHPNDRGDEITAIETELGLLPKGPFSDLVTRLNKGPVMKLTNKSGSTRSSGDLVMNDSSNDSGVTTTTTQGKKRVAFYVVLESITNNSEGYVQHEGLVTINVQGNVTRGNYLRSSTTAAKAEDAGSALVDGVFAIALTSYGGGGAGTVTAILFGSTHEAISGWSLVGTITLTDAASGSLSGLLGNTDHQYKVIFRAKYTFINVGSGHFRILPNGVTTNTFHRVKPEGDYTTLLTGSGAGFLLSAGDGSTATVGEEVFGEIMISSRTNSDQYGECQPYYGNSVYCDGSANLFAPCLLGGGYVDSTEITSLTFGISGASDRCTGKVWVYKPGNP